METPSFGDIKEYTAWIGGCLAASLPVIRWIAPWVVKQINRRHQERVVEGLKSLGVIYRTMEEASALGASRCVIFGAHDDGGMPRPGAPFYTDALYWQVPDEFNRKVAHYKGVPVDAAYIRLLLEIKEKGYMRMDLSEGAPDSLLLRMCRAEKVEDSLVFFLYIKDHTFFYITFANCAGKFSDDQVLELSFLANIIARQIEAS